MTFTTPHPHRRKRVATSLSVLAVAAALVTLPTTAQAYSPAGDVVYQIDGDQACLKGLGNCAVYPKSAELPSGKLVMAFERSTVVESSQSATGQTMPVYTSADQGASWQPTSEVPAPAYLSDDPAYAKYTSNWTNPYLYVLPEAIGDLAAGTLLLASVVSGEDEYYVDHKQRDPNWVPNNDGDRRDVAIALYASTDEGASWTVDSIIATGGWQGGSAGAIGNRIAAANTTAQVDPVWEPHLLVHDGQLIAFYSDENDYLGVDQQTGTPIIDPDNETAPDSHGQILVHRTWDGSGSDWSAPVVDVAGGTVDRGDGKSQIGGGRPGMTTVVPTSDGRWLMSFEYFGGGDKVRYQVADDPARFASADTDGEEIGQLPVPAGLPSLARGGGSPVLVALRDGRLLYNESSSGNIWVNESGRSDGEWTAFQTPIGGGYSRTMQYVSATGTIVILHAGWGGPGSPSVIRHVEVDLGQSVGTYYRVVNRKTGQVLGTGGNITDANLGNADQPDVVLETGAADQADDTQYWHLVTKSDGAVVLLNQAGGREASIWTGNAVTGQRIGQWVDDNAGGRWNAIRAEDGSYRFSAVRNSDLFLSGGTVDGPATLQPTSDDGSQDWILEERADVVPVSISPHVESEQPGAGGWNRAATTVSLSSTPEDSTIEYRLDEGEWTPYDAPVTVTTDGRHLVAYRALRGGVPVPGSEGSVPVDIDASAPSVSGTIDQRRLLATATDSTSGVAAVEFRVAGADWTPLDPHGSVLPDTGRVELRASDRAGNVSEAIVVRDSGSPQAGLPVTGSVNSAGGVLASTGVEAIGLLTVAILLLGAGTAVIGVRRRAPVQGRTPV
jgi:hypothetical protein